VPRKLSSSSLRSAAQRCRSPPSSSSEAADPVVLADATDVSHLRYLIKATARKVIPFVARTAAKRQSDPAEADKLFKIQRDLDQTKIISKSCRQVY
ncbi:VAMP-like protein, partial [Musa troglodytarum]